MDKEELLRYVLDRYGTEPEYLWQRMPEAFVLRHAANRKWYAVAMEVRRDRLGLPGEGLVWVADVKCGPLLGGSYRDLPGILPGYHMNKDHWISALLDGTVPADTVAELLEISYDMTKPTGRKQSTEG